MSTQDLQLLENQLLLSKDEAIGKLIKGTDQYYYYYFLKIFNQHGYQLTTEQKQQLEAFKDMQTVNANKTNLRALFLEYDRLSSETPSEEIDKQLKAIVDKMNRQFFKFSFAQEAPAIARGQSQSGGLIEQMTYKSKFNDSVFEVSKFLDNAYTEAGFAKIKQQLYGQLDVNKIAASSIKVIKTYLNNVGNEIVDFPGIPEFYDKLSNLKDFKNDFQQAHFRKLSLSQLEGLLQLNKKFLENQQFVGEYYLKKFQYNLKDIQYSKLTEDEKKQVLQNIKDVYNWTSTLPPKFKSFNDQILYELLQIGIEVNEFDFDLFLVFLKDPKDDYDAANEKQKTFIKNNKRNYQQQWHEYHQLNTNRWIATDQIIEKYLQKYFEKNDDLGILEQYLDTKYLKKVQATVKLHQGQELQNIYDYLTSAQIEQMNSSKLLTICSFNKMYFKHGDSVKLYVELKNIPKLNIKIFEFNSENYYLQKQQQLDSSINLDGLIAFEETDFTYNYPPIQKVIKEFEFQTITNIQRGIFIVEFIGNGISSRALIKKGRLQLRETITAAGHRFQIFDENFELCTGEKTGVWIDKKFYNVDQSRKEILIPFGQRDQQFNAVIVHDNFAEFTTVFIQQEKYQLKCAFLIADESLLMGCQAKAVIIPKLFVNGTEVGLALLQDQKIQVTSTNDAGVPATLPFDNIKLENDKPFEVQFPITSKLKAIEIKITGKITRMHKDDNKKEDQLEQSHFIYFDNLEGQQVFCNQQLKYDKINGYQILIVGKNGEPKRGLQVTVTFTLSSLNHTYNEQFTTDEKGRVYLGELKNVNSISSNVKSVGDINVQQKLWQINQKSQISYPSKITVLPGQEINLPFNDIGDINNPFVLYQVFGSTERAVIRSLTDQIKKQEQFIAFKLENKGIYELQFVKDRFTIYINVIDGELWKGSSIIKSQNQLIIDKGLDQLIAISKVDQKKEENGTKITGKIVSKQKVQVYAYATSFVNEQFEQQVNQIQQLINKDRSEQLSIDLYSSVFQSNKELSDEQKYVLNRKTQERYIGNTLEKPQFLLKRQKIRETTTQGESLNQEGSYKDKYEQQNQQSRAQSKQAGYGSAGQRHQQVTTFNDFLKYPAILYSNVGLDENNNFQLDVPTQYSTVTLLVFNESSYQFQILPLDNEDVQTRNLAHLSTLQKDKFYSIYRNSSNVQKNVPIQVQDLTSTEIKLVDSLDKMFIVLKELKKANGDDSGSRDFQKWEFLIKWYQQTTEQKHKLYDEHQCDELNLFIFFKDSAFFETYTESYIKNKIEKSFIDYFLLKDDAALRQYGSMQKITELNALEQALLVIYFAEISNQLEDAKQIASYLENLNKQNIIDQRIFKKYFDTVLGAKIEAEDENQVNQGDMMFAQQQMIQQVQQPVQRNLMCMNQAPAPRMMMMQQAMPSQAPMMQMNVQQDRMRMPMVQQAIGGLRNASYNACDDINLCYDTIGCDFPVNQAKSDSYYREKRSQFIENFKNIEKTKEYCEKHYSAGCQKDNFKNLVSLNGFYVDLVNHSITKGILKEDFLSSKFIYCINNQTEMIAVLALIGLPNEAPVQEYKQFGGKGVEITTKSSALFFMKEIKEGKAQLRQDILIAQRFFDPIDRYIISEDDPELQLEKDVSECLIDKIYGCQVIITNCSSTRADYQVLVELPNGAIPVNTVFYTKSYTINCQPYTTQRIEYFFYFPKVGTFSVYPANVSRFGQVVCVAQEGQLKVVESKSIQNLEAIDDILAKGSKDDILNFLSTKNIFNRNIFRAEEIRYLLKDKDFYLKVIAIYRKRRFSDFESLKFSIYHADKESMKELFLHNNCQDLFRRTFKYFKCSLFEVSNIRMLEYYPLITKRVHKLTSEAKGILNVEFRTQYIDFLTYLVEKPTHTLSDKLGFIYYLLLQERINEAIQVYKTIADVEAQGEAVLQYDYFSAYLDFYIGYPNFAKAREICEKYLNYPVIHWRNIFYEVVNLLAEYDGDDDENQKLKTETTVKQKQIEQAKKEETLTSVIEGNEIQITYSNLNKVVIQFYKIDLEILFSRNPFLNQNEEDFAFVLPNSIVEASLEAMQQPGLTYKKSVPIPEELRKFNLFIQIKGASKRTSNRFYSTSLGVQVMENYGQIRVSDSEGKYLSKVYVKAYIKEKNGKESFYKDGYTDLRGRFDYASLSSANLDDASKFSLLITSDEYGSIIKEIKAPSQVGKFETEVKLVSNKWNERAVCEQVKQSNLYECKKLSKCK
ncbi:unnamed protein product [Paramecium octaurelia]|uniref:Uncharacterized protein n=1 Tax=Paramecium octaurelia TaxID=43137 RepID=A0A8S1SQ84_PAROT|nr:unnamed protein product [Paramecium octaurelia]